jgi:hypothetical protein
LEPSLVYGLSFEDLEPLSVWSGVGYQRFSSVYRSAFPGLEQLLEEARVLYPLLLLSFFVIIKERRKLVMIVLLEVEGPQFLIHALDVIIAQLVHHILEILKAELGVQLLDVLHDLALELVSYLIFVLHLLVWRLLGK